ncbi:hypothetical protein ACFZBU_46485 [Embleya sp. NPDC008237]|uniref:hypothetical protein n=1 Tax=Embleya sp. NPDC008237 TaxID=3363978 RepID=UPI0036E8CEAB
MATFHPSPRFEQDYRKLDDAQRERFRRAVRTAFRPDLDTGSFRPGLRVKRVQGTKSVWEMTWAPNGRATWEYGEPVRAGHKHVLWRRIGTHDIFDRP